ncbi:hypothetical protein D3C73_1109200 [compost metagenome]
MAPPASPAAPAANTASDSSTSSRSDGGGEVMLRTLSALRPSAGSGAFRPISAARIGSPVKTGSEPSSATPSQSTGLSWAGSWLASADSIGLKSAPAVSSSGLCRVIVPSGRSSSRGISCSGETSPSLLYRSYTKSASVLLNSLPIAAQLLLA